MMGSKWTMGACRHPCQKVVADRVGLTDRHLEPAHPRGCPHTVRHKANPCAQHEGKKSRYLSGRGLLRQVKPGCQTRALLFLQGTGSLAQSCRGG